MKVLLRSKTGIAIATAMILFMSLVFVAEALSDRPLNLVAPGETRIGSPFLVYVSAPKIIEDLIITWEGATVSPEVEILAGGCEAMVLVGTDVGSSKPGPGVLEVSSVIEGESFSITRHIDVIHREFPVQRLSLPAGMVTPPEGVLERIKIEREESLKALETMTSARKWTIPFTRPVPGVITSPYGFRRILNGQPRAPHRGVDYRAREGDPILAAADGTVVLSADHYYAGECLYVDHGNGVVTVYMHLSRRLAEEGDLVSAGDVIALAGRTGRVTGPHLHFGLSLQGKMVDPEPLLEKSK
ncbi:MAG TPA: M23 family metallopeptidase [Synergistales bacterium]|nr:M23 family metallopeptidase [Synergistales bacterium]HRV71062.1 M23 family metallopeptidase [Thermovirgaceae bacterium]